MPKRRTSTRQDERPAGGDDVTQRLRRHLGFLGLNLTLKELEQRLSWATQERPGATALLEHILGVEVEHKLEQRIARRVDTSGLIERKTLETFD